MSLYLVPASRINLEQTIEKPVPVGRFEGYMEPSTLRELLIATDDVGLFCWAMTETRLKPFREMKRGDDILFTESGTGAFTHYGQVVGKIHNRALGNSLWPFVKDKPWELIYFVRNVQSIRIPKESMVVALSYASNFAVPGTLKVKPEKLTSYEHEYGCLCESLGLHVSRDDLLLDDETSLLDYSSNDILSLGKRRLAHDSWAKQVKQNYRFRCAVSDISERDFLIAGHIVPWSINKNSRLDPGNGICFSVFYDRAFEKGYFTLASDLRIDVAPTLDSQSPLGKLLCPLQGKSIRLPRHHRPREEYLAYHRQKSVQKWSLTAT